MSGVLNDVGFSVIGGLCHDVMQDLLQGVLPYKQIIEQGPLIRAWTM